MVEIVRTVADMRARVAGWRREGLRVAVVPTMGALHAGHLALVDAGLEATDRTVVTLFVNPTQFGPNEDLARYPRNEADDAAKLADRGAHLLYAPDVGEMYPDGFDAEVRIGGVTADLEADHRPGHFEGVATVVTKLLLQAGADVACFGEKDYQQLCTVRKLVRDLDIPTDILGVPTVREADGLALSSRNAYLDAGQRAIAPRLYATLTVVAGQVAGGADLGEAEAWGAQALVDAGFDAVDYVAVRDAETLAAAEPGNSRPLRVLATARLGATRLLDNVAVPAANRG